MAKNYKDTQGEIHLVNFSNGRSEKIMNLNIKDNKTSQNWTFPAHYLPVYPDEVILSDGTIKSGKVIKK